MEGKVVYKSVDEYIAAFSEETQKKLVEIRALVKTAAPDVQESIQYNMPTFKRNGKLLFHLAAFKKHIGLYGASQALQAIPDLLSPFTAAKGTLQFPLNKTLSLDIIRKIVEIQAEKSA
jgi:uncharacterized protein YdhG (YjbR/CyaY superfamily)